MIEARRGLLVLTPPKYWSDPTRYNPRRLASAPKTEVVHSNVQYRGFEGDHWPSPENLGAARIIDGLGKLEDLNLFISYFRGIEIMPDLRMIAINDANIINLFPDSRFVFQGFDVGVFESLDNYFSCVYHDLIYGRIEELKPFKAALNNSLLIPTQQMAGNFLEVRQKLLRSGQDLEDFPLNEQIRILTIFQYHPNTAK